MSPSSFIQFVLSAVGPYSPGAVSGGVCGSYLLASVVTFAIYARDKSAARQGRWRTPERTLHMLALLGGWPGALLAQRVLRHKSRNGSFQVVFWASVAVNCIVITWFLRRFA